MNKHLKHFLKFIRDRVYACIHPILYPLFFLLYRKELRKVDENIQVFFLSRMDWGYFILLLTYIRFWQDLRSQTCLVILTPLADQVIELAEEISPHTKIVVKGRRLLRWLCKLQCKWPVFEKTFVPLYARLFQARLNGINLYLSLKATHPFPPNSYIPYFDPNLINPAQNIGKEFFDSYVYYRRFTHTEHNFYDDFIGLVANNPVPDPSEKIKKLKDQLFVCLGINSPYIILNINCKKYDHYTQKQVFNYQAYNPAIDMLIERGFKVVVQGRKEQPVFRRREGLVDYSKSPFCSVLNDMALYAGCSFAIMSRTGPEVFPTTYNRPVLALNFTEICHIVQNKRHRYFPKFVRQRKSGKILSWREYFNGPYYFHLGCVKNFGIEEVEFVELDEDDIMHATLEFLPLLSQPEEKWLEYTPLQREFKAAMTPLHMDNYRISGVPCDFYLNCCNTFCER